MTAHNKRNLFNTRLISSPLLMFVALWPSPNWAQNSTLPAPQAQLQQQIEQAEQNFRDDLVVDAIARWQRLNPDAPELLAAQIRYAVKTKDLAQAQTYLGRLREVAPGSALLQQSEQLLAIDQGPLHTQLEQAQLFDTAGQLEKARDLYDRVYQGVFPSTDDAINYHLLQLRIQPTDAKAHEALATLFQTHPSHPRLLEYYANQAFAADQPERAIAHLRQWGQRSAWTQRAADREFQYWESLRASPRQLHGLKDFVDHYPTLSSTQAARTHIQQLETLLAESKWQAGYQALQKLEANQPQSAIPLFKQALQQYPDDTELIGGLGLAYLRAGQRQAALAQFKEAQAKETFLSNHARWESLVESTEYWSYLAQGDQALEQNRLDAARNAYLAARQLDADDPNAWVGLANVALAQGQREESFNLYLQALKRDATDGGAFRGLNTWLSALSPTDALTQIRNTPVLQGRAFATYREEFELALLSEKLEAAMQAEDWAHAEQLNQRYLAKRPNDVWAHYRAASLARQRGATEAGLEAFQHYLTRHQGDPTAQYAYALLLNSADQPQAARASLATVPRAQWDGAMHELDQALELRLLQAEAERLRTAGDKEAAYRLWAQLPETPDTQAQLGQWLHEDGRLSNALAQYESVLAAEPERANIRLAQWRVWQEQGQLNTLRQGLRAHELESTQLDAYDWANWAELWQQVGEPQQAKRVLENAIAQPDTIDPLLYRDLSRLERRDTPQQALTHLAAGLNAVGMNTPVTATTEHDKARFTAATRSQDEDDWLLRSLRSDASSLYQQQMPTVQLNHFYAKRNDGTPGLSRLKASTTVLHMDHPVGDGKAFIQFDHVRLNPGDFVPDAGGTHTEDFGTCNLAAPNSTGDTVRLAGCHQGLHQRAQGTGAAIGWRNEQWEADIGLTPRGFAVKNWAGGLSYASSISSVGTRFTLSRRPLSSSLLSFAGATDPRTGITWGGVMATGARIGLSWDQGEDHGVWSSLEHHLLRGKNVANNTRTRLMGGYYYRLINRSNEELSIGVNAMLWRHQKDLGDYTLGQGGYYSPQRYRSLSLPVRYDYRNSDWSVSVGGSVSRSYAKTKGGDRYPLVGLLHGPYQQLKQQGADPSQLRAAQTFGPSSSWGTGYQLFANVERRLSNRWIVGGGTVFQKSQDYSPNNFFLYLRYSFEPWQGDLAKPPQPNTPYAEF